MKAKDVKAKFRQTKAWKEFRKRMFEKQGGKDTITGIRRGIMKLRIGNK